MLGQAGMPKETIGTIADIMIEAGKSERIQKILDTFGVDDPRSLHEFQAIYAAEGPIWIDLVSKLKIARSSLRPTDLPPTRPPLQTTTHQQQPPAIKIDVVRCLHPVERTHRRGAWST
jgi:hypothetical protein